MAPALPAWLLPAGAFAHLGGGTPATAAAVALTRPRGWTRRHAGEGRGMLPARQAGRPVVGLRVGVVVAMAGTPPPPPQPTEAAMAAATAAAAEASAAVAAAMASGADAAAVSRTEVEAYCDAVTSGSALYVYRGLKGATGGG
ncbi:hypothetical protein MMPV_004334 [Pyropia vietnamensis]